jgi:8-oxo-dGTP diphosphatase
MSLRSRVILIDQGRLALIRRVRDRRTFHVFPGGGVEPGETPEQAAVREAAEELGVDVALGPLVAKVRRESGSVHHFYLATLLGGTFGTSAGPEWSDTPARAKRGTYEAVWVPIAALDVHDVRPAAIANRIAARIPWDAQYPLELDD